MTLVVYLQILVPVLVVVIGFFGALKISVVKNSERIDSIKSDIAEIKSDVKYIKRGMIK